MRRLWRGLGCQNYEHCSCKAPSSSDVLDKVEPLKEDDDNNDNVVLFGEKTQEKKKAAKECATAVKAASKKNLRSLQSYWI